MVAQPLLSLAAPTTANQLLSYVRSPELRDGDLAGCRVIRANLLQLPLEVRRRKGVV